MYLYDLKTGQPKNPITSGAGPITRIAKLDSATRTMWYEAVGKEKGQDPYFTHLYRVGLDGKNNVSLTPDNGTHSVQISPDGKYVVDTFSQPDVAPETTLRDGATGALIMPLEKADISKLLATGWKPPMQIKMTAADGKTDIYGMLFRPTNFDPSKKYPIINNAYPGPQSGSVGSRAFTAARGDKQALAELGFVVVSIDGTGTPNRSKAYTDAYYGAMGRHNTIPDQIAGMKELAKKYPWIDIDKAAMWGHSGGGFITADALLRAPYNDFFKVGIAESGNHDQRQYQDDWGERYQGPLVKNPDGTDNYADRGDADAGRRPEGASAADPRHDGQQRAALQHAARRRRADQGEQGVRHAAHPELGARLYAGELRHAAAVGLLRQVPARCRSAEGLRDSGGAGRRRAWRPRRRSAPSPEVSVRIGALLWLT